MITKKQAAYLHVHLFWSFCFTLFIMKVFGIFFPIAGIFPGAIIEIIQMIRSNKIYIFDIFIDLLSWTLGGFLIYLI